MERRAQNDKKRERERKESDRCTDVSCAQILLPLFYCAVILKYFWVTSISRPGGSKKLLSPP